MLTLNEYLRRKYGEKLYRISLSSGCTCPNRDGTIGTNGCIFCLNGSGDFAETGDIDTQIENAKKRVAKKTKTNKFIAYFGSYTNTYTKDLPSLERLYTTTLLRDDIEILSIGTRPDCLCSDVLAMLERLNKIKPVWVELGLQTSNENTAEYIRRGYANEVYSTAVENLHKIGIEVITHIIIGLPGENISDMENTVKFAVENKTDGIKLQLLHVLENTDLAKDYKSGKFSVLSMEEYCDILCDLLKIIPENVVIHRFTGDGNKKYLIAPLWSGDKKKVINYITERIRYEV